MRLLLDTNVIIDVLQRREPRFRDSRAVVLACARGLAEGCLTAKSLTDVFYLMHRHYHANEPCLDVIRKLYKLFRIADTSAQACLRATFSLVGDYEDAVMDETAHDIGADYIVTDNTKDFAHSRVPAITPTEAVALMLVDVNGAPVG